MQVIPPRCQLAAGLLLVGMYCGCHPDTRPAKEDRTSPQEASARSDQTTWFVDVTDKVGIDFVHDPGPVDDRYFMPQIVGSGAALFDGDGDGRLDVYLVNNGGPKGRPSVFYRQLPNGHFEDISKASGMDLAGFGMGVAVGDVNNDGLLDVVVTEFGAIHLLVNRGGARFELVRDSGLSSSLWGTSACFLDFDRDGWLDLAVANYLDYDPAWPCANATGARDYCHPSVFSGTAAKLFRNTTGDSLERGAVEHKIVRFEDVTALSGIARVSGPGLGIASADFDGDDWPDVLIANDAHPNHLWINQRDGTFVEEGVSRGLAYDAVGRSLANMGVALGDVRRQGDFDLLITHLTEETPTLWRQGPRGVFSDQTSQAGLLGARYRGTGFGAMLADFDQDGWLDLAIANGRVVRAANSDPMDHWGAYTERNQLFAGRPDGRFQDRSDSAPDFCATGNVGRALAMGDLDQDGSLDLLLTTAGGRARVLKNVSPNRGCWLQVEPMDPRWKRLAFGARVTVTASERPFVAWLNPGQGYLTSHEPLVHFGLERAEAYESLEVRWPDGYQERFSGGRTNRRVKLVRGEGTSVMGGSPTPATAPSKSGSQ